MRRYVAAIALSFSFLVPHTALAYRERGDCNREGNCNDQRRCSDAGDNCRGSFSPGPFDRSPVDVHDNQVCISPNCSSSPQDKPPKDGSK